MKFHDIPYQRINLDVMKKQAEAITADLKTAKTYEQAKQAFLHWQEFCGRVHTASSVANTRNNINTADEFYEQERIYWNNADPVIAELSQNFTLVMLDTPFRKEFEQEYGSLYFENAEIELKAFSPAIAKEMQEENELVMQYDKLIASAQIPFDGKLLTLSQLTPYKQSADDSIRKAAWEAEGNWFEQNSADLDEIYDKLVHLRDTMAKKMGYDNYIQLGYYQMMRNCYTKEDVEKFRQAVLKYIVPICVELKKEQAKRIGAEYPMSFADDSLMFRSGNATPVGTPDEILANAKKMYHELSPETAEFIDWMYDNEMLDVLSRKGKSGGGYCTSFPVYKTPFIFANFNGTAGDVEVVTHEAGHAFAGYTARNILPLENQNPTLESCEIHSMSMEFFAEQWSHYFFGDDAEKFKYSHLASALFFIPYGTIVDYFQHIIYEHPEYTPAQRHEVWAKLESDFRPWLKLEGTPFYEGGKGWQAKMHIYERPFYYIDYCLAQTVALQFWALIQKDRSDAWNRYLALVKEAGTKTFNGLVETAGLDTPFGEDALKTIAEAGQKFLDNFDTTALK